MIEVDIEFDRFESKSILRSLYVIKLYPNSGITNEFAVFIEVVIAFFGAYALLSLTRLLG